LQFPRFPGELVPFLPQGVALLERGLALLAQCNRLRPRVLLLVLPGGLVLGELPRQGFQLLLKLLPLRGGPGLLRPEPLLRLLGLSTLLLSPLPVQLAPFGLPPAARFLMTLGQRRVCRRCLRLRPFQIIDPRPKLFALACVLLPVTGQLFPLGPDG